LPFSGERFQNVLGGENGEKKGPLKEEEGVFENKGGGGD